MQKKGDPIVEKSTGEDFTRVTFRPDLKRFGMSELEDDIIALMSRRAFDVAGSTRGVKVFLNNKLIPVCNVYMVLEIGRNLLIELLEIFKSTSDFSKL